MPKTKPTVMRRMGLLSVTAVMAFSSCTKEKGVPAGMDEWRQEMARRVETMADTDSLQRLADDYAAQDNYMGAAIALNQKGKILHGQHLFAEAIVTESAAADMAERANDTLSWVMALNTLGSNYRKIGLLNDAVENHLRALLMSQQADYEHNDHMLKNRVMALNGLANVYLTMHNAEQADSLLRVALEGERRLGSDLGQAINLANFGAIKEMQGDQDSAWVFYRLSLEKNEQCQSKEGMALCHDAFGRLYEQENQLEKALQEYQKAGEIMAESKNGWHLLKSQLNVARVYIRQHRHSEAEKLIGQVSQTTLQLSTMEHRAEAHRLLYELTLNQGKHKEALEHYVKAEELKDSLMDMEKISQVQNMRLAYERNAVLQQQEAKEQDLMAERRLTTELLIVISIVFLLALAFIFILWYALHLRNVKYRINREVSKAREMFFTNVTHEFRTPLTVILGLGHQLEGDNIEDMAQVRSAAKMIVRQGNSLLDLINKLLEVSKARLAATEPRWRHGNVVAFAEMVFDNFRPYANNKFIELTFSHSLTEIETDFVPDYVQKIISNLLSNAVKYTPKYGKVNMTLEQTANNRIKLQVFDTGCGIRPEAIPHVFEPFYQDDHSAKEVGTGIGLSIVKLMTEFMGGSVEVQSIVGQGSTFTVVLPIMQRDDVRELDEDEDIHVALPSDLDANEADEQPNEDASQPDEAAMNGPKPRVLIVEDNQDIAHYIGMQLSPRCHTTYARTGDEAMEKALEQIPDIVITDVMMPGNTDGLQLCRNIRQSELLCHIPIIIVTAKTTEQDRIKGLEAGADAYLVKPFNSEELLLRVRKLLERQQQLREHFAQLPPDATQREEQLSREDLRFLSRMADNVYKLMAQGKTDVESLAGEMCMTRSQLNRKVLAVTGQNVSTYMMRLRLARAKRLLKAEPGLSIGDVATKCGFDDLGYFSRIFRQNFNMTPSQYRRIE